MRATVSIARVGVALGAMVVISCGGSTMTTTEDAATDGTGGSVYLGNPPALIDAGVTTSTGAGGTMSTGAGGNHDATDSRATDSSAGGDDAGELVSPDVSVNNQVDACAPLPCPSGAPWNPVSCTCTPVRDAGADVARDASLVEDAADAYGTCTLTLDAYCAQDAGPDSPCMRTWSATPAPAQWCHSAGDRVFVRPNCGGYDLIVHAGVDTAQMYYYDMNTHALLRFVYSGAPATPICGAGTPGPFVSSWVTCTDAALSSICGRDASN